MPPSSIVKPRWIAVFVKAKWHCPTKLIPPLILYLVGRAKRSQLAADLNDPKGCKIWGDQYQDSVKSLDFKLQYDITEYAQLYFDAINLTEESDLRYFQGNALSGGNILYQKEEYGRSYQLGVNIKFY